LNRAYLGPSCGLEFLPRDRARQKLKHLAVIRNTFLGSPA
jgi:methionine synthase II (cobalamin-independent)